LSYVIVIIIAVPLYVCATASLPIAAGLMLSGVLYFVGFVMFAFNIYKTMTSSKKLTEEIEEIIKEIKVPKDYEISLNMRI
ncbi:MAG TPA: hypothetical protein EYP22_05460, partial [Methanosarcinales archaeon]|nr:hypothetical protein [Methanosarcinales archaeon]